MMSPFDCYLGIDPGKHGGLALVSCDDIAQAWPMPLRVDSKGKVIVDEAGIGRLFRTRIRPANVSHCIIELVHSMPRDGVASAFKFGRNTGILLGMLIAHEIPFEEMPPETWQQALGIKARAKLPKGRGLMLNFPPAETKHQWKKRLMKTAQGLFPNLEVTLDTADALMMAEVAKRKETGYRGRPVICD